PLGAASPDWVVADAELVKSDCPNAKRADWPFVVIDPKTSTLLKSLSAIYIRNPPPDPEKVIPEGDNIVDPETVLEEFCVVKSGRPITYTASGLFEETVANISTLLLPVSAM